MWIHIIVSLKIEINHLFLFFLFFFFNQTMFPVYLSHTPAGSSTYQLVHFVQEARSGRFCQFDMGSPQDNFRKYGSITPPDYNLANVRARVILHYADNDWLSSPIDVQRLYQKLPNSEMNHIPDERFEHMVNYLNFRSQSVKSKLILIYFLFSLGLCMGHWSSIYVIRSNHCFDATLRQSCRLITSRTISDKI